ncbi:alpha/beta hydrolase [Streptomyces sp. SS7]|uniref:alpha/beta hydrolase n=1 Tax=Streptomyces sp. SS7 TaxID=3108485 RepID=UPI0030EB1D0D
MSSAVAGCGPAECDRVVHRALGRTKRWASLADGLRACAPVRRAGGRRGCPQVVQDIHRARRLDPPHPLGSPDAPPLLLVASAHDSVTMIEGVRQWRRLLQGSRLLTLDNDYSHGVFARRVTPAWATRRPHTSSTGRCRWRTCAARGPDCLRRSDTRTEKELRVSRPSRPRRANGRKTASEKAPAVRGAPCGGGGRATCFCCACFL